MFDEVRSIGIDWLAVAQHREVQVAAGRPAGGADVPDDVAAADPGALETL